MAAVGQGAHVTLSNSRLGTRTKPLVRFFISTTMHTLQSASLGFDPALHGDDIVRASSRPPAQSFL